MSSANSSSETSEVLTDLVDDEEEFTNKIPMILIVVQGGPNTLFTVAESIKKRIPILVLSESQGCADLIVNASFLIKPT